MTCVVSGCQGQVQFGSKRAEHYCRKHEGLYLLDEEVLSWKTLQDLESQIGIRDDGCWQFEQVWGNGLPRPSLKSAGLQWKVSRFLYIWYFGGHKGGLELGHICHQEWCVNPGHLEPVTGQKNRKDRDVLNKSLDDLTRADRRRFDSLILEAEVIAFAPVTPTDQAGAAELEEFAGRLGRALPAVVPATVPAPSPVVDATRPVKAKVDLFVKERPQRDGARLRGHKATLHGLQAVKG